ncbi:GntR family transcriptional regulator [Paenibacillus sp. UNC499MF]|uniref:GntR family transcriptional regulator n=1 Tax=Paenibacillus sp. UNC499MF TaxID=1502751 RepID=UPI0008A086AA|nr:GntR family transcriptional regulator [Paenibacillus sp. UNC499MF]SEG64644.1 DNA-binding transcriptional regulator, GntR family [Paenibacillus sp. UNC499MF]
MSTRQVPRITSGKSLGEQAYDALRDSIITLKLEPGQTIFESEIADTFKISRTPIRDAFQLLVTEHLIEVLPQRHKKIARISESKVKESSFVRLSLESSAFKLAAGGWDSSEKFVHAERQIGRILREQSEAADHQDVVQFLQLDEAFHKCILELTGNATLLEVVYHMRGHLNRLRYLAMKELVLTEKLVEEHLELFDSLKKNDETGTVQLLERHLGNLDHEIPQLREQFPHYFTD